jgi:hypothetical protein
MVRKGATPILLAALVCAAPVSGLSLSDLVFDGGLLFIGASGPVPISPAFVPTLGVSLPIEIIEFFFAEPALDFTSLYYGYIGGRAVPVPMESLSGFLTVFPVLSLQAGVRFDLTDVLQLGGSLGFDFAFRFPMEFQNTGPTNMTDMGSAFGYMYSMGRFFYPETRLFLRWQALDSLALVFSVRAFYPLFHLWDGEVLPFIDQFMLSGSVGFAFRLFSPR